VALAADELAHRDVGVGCPGFWTRLVEITPNAGWVDFDEHGRPSDETSLSATTCRGLERVWRRDQRSYTCLIGGGCNQDTVRAVLTMADETGARVALVGDRHQLPAVGRGGVLDLAARWARPETVVSLNAVHRFTDPQYADLSLAMRTGVRAAEVFDTLLQRGHLRLYPTEAERTQALADLAAQGALTGRTGPTGVLVMADTREQVTALNGAIRDRLLTAGYLDAHRGVVTDAGDHLGVGDRVMTRRNDRDLAVANRDTWTITGIDPGGTITVQGDGRTGSRSLPAGYVHKHVELAYATTVHGAQGETTHTGHLVLGEHTSPAAAYVAMTRGREANVAHLVAEDHDDARQAWIETFGRDRADLGPAHAAMRAAEDLERYAPHRPLEPALAELRAAWTDEQDLRDALTRYQNRHPLMAENGEPDPSWVTERTDQIDELRDQLTAATDQVRASLLEPVFRSLPAGRVEQEHADWLQYRRDEQQEAQATWEHLTPSRPSPGRAPYRSPSTPGTDRGISR